MNGSAGNSKTGDNGGNDDDASDEIQRVMDLMTRRAQGETSNDEVEAAVSQVLTKMMMRSRPATAATAAAVKAEPKSTTGAIKSGSRNLAGADVNGSASSAATSACAATPVMMATLKKSLLLPPLELDESDYDDDDNDGKVGENDDEGAPGGSAEREGSKSDAGRIKAKRTRVTFSSDTKEGNKKRLIDDADDMELPSGDREYMEKITSIPMGKECRKMMVTFGDGPHPDPEVVSAVLIGTRKCLHAAILDARALRRHSKQAYAQARDEVTVFRQTNAKALQNTTSSANASMIYRAMSGHDKLAYDPPCGFDKEQLLQLYPEEIRSYSRWQEMHNQYAANADKRPGVGQTEDVGDALERDEDEEGGGGGGDDDAENDENEGNNKDDEVQKEETDTKQQEPYPGYLQERAAQFDDRTKRMKDEWYMQFSRVRRGSFLRRSAGKNDAAWEAYRKSLKTRGRKSHKSWETMSAPTVKFLYWLGFNPPTIPPPNDEETGILAFLGYNFLGRIVERAIFLRIVERMDNVQGDHAPATLSELPSGEQLTLTDIEKAMNDPSIQKDPIYGDAEKTLAPPPQLYFGPGFEDRLEMELDELLASHKAVSEEERKIRADEHALFSSIKPPEIADSIAHLMGDKIQDKTPRKRRRKKEEVKSSE